MPNKVFIENNDNKLHIVEAECSRVTDFENGYRCTCGEGILAKNKHQAKKIHAFNLQYDREHSN